MDFKYLIRSFSNVPLNRQVILDMLQDYKRPNDKISELIKAGELIPMNYPEAEPRGIASLER
jgi:hypothetical protein